jgi:hypothetical protein
MTDSLSLCNWVWGRLHCLSRVRSHPSRRAKRIHGGKPTSGKVAFMKTKWKQYPKYVSFLDSIVLGE